MSDGQQRVNVILPLGLGQPLTYLAPPDWAVGQAVAAPVGTKIYPGLIWGAGNTHLPAHRLKPLQPLDTPPLQPAMLKFLQFAADYTLNPPGSLWRMVLGGGSLLGRDADLPNNLAKPDTPHAPLTPAQSTAIAPVLADIAAHKHQVTVLAGVTGAGKTETYCEAIAATLRAGRQALVLLPEIALTASLYERFATRFGHAPTRWHSGLTPKQRRQNWWSIATGAANLVVGARSALFLPYQSLGLIVVDEEHDLSFKQDENPIYHARDMAVMRGHFGQFPVILSSATPSLETQQNVQNQRYRQVALPARFGSAQLPAIKLIDLRADKLPNGSWLSLPLRQAIEATAARGEQSLLFLNRRGYAPLTLCRSCGHRLQCKHCSAWLVYHAKRDELICHHCGYTAELPPACTSCGATDSWANCGPGVERVAEEAAKIFPTLRRVVLASDLIKPKELPSTLSAITNGGYDLIIGTQLLTKGHHFPLLTLVGVVDGDMGLGGADVRAAEHSLQLLQQVAGRSGRADKPGQALIQTYLPDHPVMQTLAEGKITNFYAAELAERQRYGWPPFQRLAALVVSGYQAGAASALADYLARRLQQHPEIMVLGPAPAPLARLRRWHRFRLLLKAAKPWQLQQVLSKVLAESRIPRQLKLQVDIDPYHFL